MVGRTTIETRLVLADYDVAATDEVSAAAVEHDATAAIRTEHDKITGACLIDAAEATSTIELAAADDECFESSKAALNRR